MSIAQLIADHPNKTDAEIAAIASEPFDVAIPLSAATFLLLDYIDPLKAWGETLGPAAPRVRRLVNGILSQSISEIAASDAPMVRQLAPLAAQAGIIPSEVATALVSATQRSNNVTSAEVRTVRKQPGRDVLANKLARLSADAMAKYDADEPIEIAALWSAIE